MERKMHAVRGGWNEGEGTNVVGLALFLDGVVVGVEIEEDGREQTMAVSSKEADAVLAASRVHLALI
jgi:hypothetical protein